jgi:hypothetical protein
MMDKINLYLCLGALGILFIAMMVHAIELAFYSALFGILAFLCFRLYMKVVKAKK